MTATLEETGDRQMDAELANGTISYDRSDKYIHRKVGDYKLSATYKPRRDLENKFRPVIITKTIQVILLPESPLIFWDIKDSHIEYGTPFSRNFHLNAQTRILSASADANGLREEHPAPIPGTFLYETCFIKGQKHEDVVTWNQLQEGDLIDSGVYSFKVTFLPDRVTAMKEATLVVNDVVIHRREVSLLWIPPTTVISANTPVASLLNARFADSNFAQIGKIEYSVGPSTVFPPGQYEITARVLLRKSHHTNYKAVKNSIQINVVYKLSLQIEWDNPPALKFGEPLSIEHYRICCVGPPEAVFGDLDPKGLRIGGVVGDSVGKGSNPLTGKYVSFRYQLTPQIGTVLVGGQHHLRLEMIPDEKEHCVGSIHTIAVEVKKKEPTIIWDVIPDLAVYQRETLPKAQFNAVCVEQTTGEIDGRFQYYYVQGRGKKRVEENLRKFEFPTPNKKYPIWCRFVPATGFADEYEPVSKMIIVEARSILDRLYTPKLQSEEDDEDDDLFDDNRSLTLFPAAGKGYHEAYTPGKRIMSKR